MGALHETLAHCAILRQIITFRKCIFRIRILCDPIVMYFERFDSILGKRDILLILFRHS